MPCGGFGKPEMILYLMMLLGGSMISLTELSSLVLEADQTDQQSKTLSYQSDTIVQPSPNCKTKMSNL